MAPCSSRVEISLPSPISDGSSASGTPSAGVEAYEETENEYGRATPDYDDGDDGEYLPSSSRRSKQARLSTARTRTQRIAHARGTRKRRAPSTLR